jgi:hypothetical protein
MEKLKGKHKDKRKRTGSSPAITNLGKIFDKHIKFEFEDKNVKLTMKTMVKERYVHHVPVMTGGIGYENVSYPYELVYR